MIERDDVSLFTTPSFLVDELAVQSFFENERVMRWIVYCGAAKCTKVIVQNKGSSWLRALPCDVAISTASLGRVTMLQVLVDYGYPMSEQTIKRYARYGHLDCVRFLHEQGCPWSSDTILLAAKYGHLDCVKYAYEYG